jgi:hypothetical protein
MKLKSFQTAFVSGELSPDLYARESLGTYENGLAEARNVYILPQGGAKRREGLRKIDVVSGNIPVRLISFEFNAEQVYLIVVGPGFLKVYRDDVPVANVTTSPISNITAAMLPELKWTQSADTLLLFHRSLQTIRVTRTSHTSWVATHAPFTNIPNFDYGSGAEAVISATRGWPRCGAFKYGRLWLLGLGSRPQTILGSKTQDYFNLDQGTGLDNEAINVTIDDDRVNQIRNAFPGRALQIFTNGGEFIIQSQLGDPVAPGKIFQQLSKATLHGCNQARPVSVDGATIFVEGNGKVVRQFLFNDLEQSYNANNLSLLAPHLVQSPVQMDVRRATEYTPADYVYLVNSDGTLAVLNVLRDEKLLAWSLFTTSGNFEDVAVVGEDVYLLVSRMIGGVQIRTIEKLDENYLLDCSEKQGTQSVPYGLPWMIKPSAKTGWSDFGFYNGSTVRVLGDGYVLEDATVSGGSFAASESAQSVEIGFGFKARIVTLPTVAVIQGQSWAGDYKRLVSVDLRLLNSRGVVVEQMKGQKYYPAWRQFGTGVLDRPVQLFDGWKKIFLGGGDRDTQIIVTQDDPLEFHILGLKMSVGVS